MQSTDCLGRTRVVERVYPDGSYNCPFCNYGVMAGSAGCGNPACFARAYPPFPPDQAKEILRQIEARKRAEAEREELARWRRENAEQSARERSEWLESVVSQAADLGYCLRHARQKSDPFRRKAVLIRHRKGCTL